MAVARRKTGKYTTNFIRVLYFNVNDEDIEGKVNLCINDNDDSDVVDIKLSECQAKAIVLIHFKRRRQIENG